MKTQIDKIISEIYKEHYDMHRRGAFDFPSEDKWVKDCVELFKLNNPELLKDNTNKVLNQLQEEWGENWDAIIDFFGQEMADKLDSILKN